MGGKKTKQCPMCGGAMPDRGRLGISHEERARAWSLGFDPDHYHDVFGGGWDDDFSHLVAGVKAELALIKSDRWGRRFNLSKSVFEEVSDGYDAYR